MLFGWPLLGLAVLEMHPVHRIQLPPMPDAKRLFSIGVGVVLGFAIFGLMALLMATPLSSFVMDGAPVVQEKMGKLGVIQHFFLFACAISILHSALEEYYWRWYVFKRLRWCFKGFAPHFIAAVAFSLHHFVITWIYFTPGLAIFLGAAVGVGGFLWSLLYEKTGSLLGPWISHVIVDFAIFWVGYQMLTQ